MVNFSGEWQIFFSYTLDTGSAAAAADGVDGAAVAEGGGEAKRSEGGDLNANDKGVDGESSSGKRVREEEKSGVENESKISNLIQSTIWWSI